MAPRNGDYSGRPGPVRRLGVLRYRGGAGGGAPPTGGRDGRWPECSGRITRALYKGEEVSEHPDTGHALIGIQVPYWDEILDATALCSDAMGLGYLGVDLAIDRELGSLVMEVNARPGLQVQNVTGVGLAERLEAVVGYHRNSIV